MVPRKIKREKIFIAEDPDLANYCNSTPANIITKEVCLDSSTSAKESGLVEYSEAPTNVSTDAYTRASVMNFATEKLENITSGSIADQSCDSDENKTPEKFNALQIVIQSLGAIDRSKVHYRSAWEQIVVRVKR
ncbi:hypothetical protein AgCh_029106 [Apium graveolens]